MCHYFYDNYYLVHTSYYPQYMEGVVILQGSTYIASYIRSYTGIITDPKTLTGGMQF